jgi:hypothetical protein
MLNKDSKVYIGNTELQSITNADPVPLIHVRLRQGYLGKTISGLKFRMRDFQRQSDAESANEIRLEIENILEKISMLDGIRKQNDKPKYMAYIKFCQSLG